LEDDAIAVPRDLVDRVEDALARLVVPELLRVAGGDVGDPERQRVAAGERRAGESRPRSGSTLRRLRLIATPTLSATALAAATASAPLAAASLRGRRVERRSRRI